MTIVPHTIDIVVADMRSALDFYRTLGLVVPESENAAGQVQVSTPGFATLGFLTEALMKEAKPSWVQPVGQRVTLACRCDSPAEVDATYERVTAAGYEGRQAPWDSFWGQRYAMLGDPDGNRVDLFAALAPQGRE